MSYEPFVGFGTRKGIVYELDQYGLPLGGYDVDAYGDYVPNTDPNTGLEIYGIRGFELTYPEPRRIPHFNGDRVGLVQQFPSLDAPGGTITVDGADLNLNSILSSVRKSTIAGIELMPFLSDQQGNEPAVGLLVYQAATRTTGVTGWHVQFIASTTLIPRPGPYGDNNYETRYALAPSAVNHFLWGFPLSLANDNATESGVVDGFAPYKPRITSWDGDNSEDIFLFDEDLKPTDTNYKVYKSTAGAVTEVTTGVTKTVDSLDFDTAPAANVTIHVLHMTA